MNTSTSTAHEIFTAAQLAPGEGIEDAVFRIAAIMRNGTPAFAAPQAVPLAIIAALNTVLGGNEWQGDASPAELLGPACAAIAALPAPLCGHDVQRAEQRGAESVPAQAVATVANEPVGALETLRSVWHVMQNSADGDVLLDDLESLRPAIAAAVDSQALAGPVQDVSPTDAQLDAVIQSHRWDMPGVRSIARTVLARWGVAPQAGVQAAPVAYEVLTPSIGFWTAVRDVTSAEGIVKSHKHAGYLDAKIHPLIYAAAQAAAQPADAQPDMFWDDADTERGLSATSEEEAVQEIAYDATPGDLPFEIVLQRAKALPNVRVRVTALADDNGNGFAYEVIDAARTQGGAA